MLGGWIRQIEKMERDWPEDGSFWRQSGYAPYFGARLMMLPACVYFLLLVCIALEIAARS